MCDTYKYAYHISLIEKERIRIRIKKNVVSLCDGQEKSNAVRRIINNK